MVSVSGEWRGSNTDKLYEELVWDILYYKRWNRRLCHLYRLGNDQRDLYTYTLIYHRNILSIIICIELTYMKELLKAPIGSLILISRTV